MLYYLLIHAIFSSWPVMMPWRRRSGRSCPSAVAARMACSLAQLAATPQHAAASNPGRRLRLYLTPSSIAIRHNRSKCSGIILSMRSAIERRYIVTSLIGWAHTQNDPWVVHWVLTWFYIFVHGLAQDCSNCSAPFLSMAEKGLSNWKKTLHIYVTPSLIDW